MKNKGFWMRVAVDVLIVMGLVLVIGGVLLIYYPSSSNDNLNEAKSLEPVSEESPEDISVRQSDLEHLGNEVSLDFDIPEGIGEYTEITIPPGSNGIRVAHILDQAGLIEFEEFNFLLTKFELSKKIKADTYIFASDISLAQLLDTILLK